MNQETQDKYLQLANDLGLKIESINATTLKEIVDALTNKQTSIKNEFLGIDLDEKRNFFTSVKPDIYLKIKTFLGIEQDNITLSIKDLIELASKLSLYSVERLIVDSITSYCQGMVSKFIVNNGGAGMAGSADNRLIEQLKKSLKQMRNGDLHELSGSKIYMPIGTGLQTFRTFCDRYGLKEFFFTEHGRAKKIYVKEIDELEAQLNQVLGE